MRSKDSQQWGTCGSTWFHYTSGVIRRMPQVYYVQNKQRTEISYPILRSPVSSPRPLRYGACVYQTALATSVFTCERQGGHSRSHSQLLYLLASCTWAILSSPSLSPITFLTLVQTRLYAPPVFYSNDEWDPVSDSSCLVHTNPSSLPHFHFHKAYCLDFASAIHRVLSTTGATLRSIEHVPCKQDKQHSNKKCDLKDQSLDVRGISLTTWSRLSNLLLRWSDKLGCVGMRFIFAVVNRKGYYGWTRKMDTSSNVVTLDNIPVLRGEGIGGVME